VTIHTFERVLAEHPFFRELPPAHLATVVGCAANVTFEAGEFVFREGDQADRFFVIREGKVAVEVFAPGRGAITIESIDGGEVLGWSWLFPPYRTHFDARALTHVRALALDGTCLRGKCEENTDLGYQFMRRFNQLVVERLEATRMQLLDLYGDGSSR
jgi:CRP/FNR family cyclic AMP-dependent transcriptional regulator